MEKVRDFWISWRNYWKNLIEFYQIKYGLYEFFSHDIFKISDYHYALNNASLTDQGMCCVNFDRYLHDNAIDLDCSFSFRKVDQCLFYYLRALRGFFNNGSDDQKRNVENYLTELKDYLNLALEKTNSSENVNVESNISLSNEIFSIRDHLSNILDLLADGDEKSKLEERLNFFDGQANKMKAILLDFDRLINISASMAPHTDMTDDLKLSIQNNVKSFYVHSLIKLQASIHQYYSQLPKHKSLTMLRFFIFLIQFSFVLLSVLSILFLVFSIFSYLIPIKAIYQRFLISS